MKMDATAVKFGSQNWLEKVETPLILCTFYRSECDETAVQFAMKHSNESPLSLSLSLSISCPFCHLPSFPLSLFLSLSLCFSLLLTPTSPLPRYLSILIYLFFNCSNLFPLYHITYIIQNKAVHYQNRYNKNVAIIKWCISLLSIYIASLSTNC